VITEKKEVKRKKMARRVIRSRYWNCNGVAIAIVAVASEVIDWAADIGGGCGSMTEHEKDAVEWTAKYGAKLHEEDAQYFFPYIALPYRG